jgi:hypothetical protein
MTPATSDPIDAALVRVAPPRGESGGPAIAEAVDGDAAARIELV